MSRMKYMIHTLIEVGVSTNSRRQVVVSKSNMHGSVQKLVLLLVLNTTSS